VTWFINKLLESNEYLPAHDITMYSDLLNEEPPSTTTAVFTGLDPNHEHRLYIMALDTAATVGYRPRHEYDTVEADYRRAPQQVLRLHGYIRMGIVGKEEVHRLFNDEDMEQVYKQEVDDFVARFESYRYRVLDRLNIVNWDRCARGQPAVWMKAG
jgi:hypothetical protein